MGGEQKELMGVPSAGDRCEQQPAAVGGRALTLSHQWCPELPDWELELAHLPSHPTLLVERGEEGRGAFSGAVPHHDNAL